MAQRRNPYSRQSARLPGPPELRTRGSPPAVQRQTWRSPQRLGRRSPSWLSRRWREGLRVLLDHLLNVLLQPHQHLLADGDVEVDLDRLVGRLDRDAAGKRERCRQSGECETGSFHFFPPGGGDRGGGGV